jgi:hypothetical protein
MRRLDAIACRKEQDDRARFETMREKSRREKAEREAVRKAAAAARTKIIISNRSKRAPRHEETHQTQAR